MRVRILVILSALFLTACGTKKECEREVYLLPPGFHGRIIVFFNQMDGAAQEFDSGARVYRIPESGYLKSRFAKNGGCMNNHRIRFFYADSTGQRTPLIYFLDFEGEKVGPDENYVVFSLLSGKTSKTDFVIHLVGTAREFNDLTSGIRGLSPESILDSLK
jgi:hypothetical protein